MAVVLTLADRRTRQLKERLLEHLTEWWPHENANYPDKDFLFEIEDAPCEIWHCKLTDVKVEGSPKGPTIWFLWNGIEVTSYPDKDKIKAFIDLMNFQQLRRSKAAIRRLASPLLVSGALALLLFGLIGTMELGSYTVPPQLWSVFTAVVAFYFGRENSQSRRSSDTSGDAEEV
jgi:hypothetical protein